MSYYDRPKPLGLVLESLIDQLGYRQKIDEARAIETWAFLAGPQINAVTEKAWVAQGKLYVRITSAPWRHELHLQRSLWRDRLNQELGRTVVEEIVFR
jgi:predicted nucleic acid-binding Zn ribbon protein